MAVAVAGANAADSAGTAVVTDGTANTLGSYVEIEDSLGADYDAVMVAMQGVAGSTTGNDALFNVATGAALSETVVIANIPYASAGSLRASVTSFGLAIASGTRVAVNVQAAATGTLSFDVVLHFWQLGTVELAGATTIDTYGANTADSGGTSIDPGGTPNTKPATFTDIVASTTAATEALTIHIPNQSNLSRSVATWLLDIATGAALSETVVIPDLFLSSSTIEDRMQPPHFPPIALVIGGATRISARAQCSITSATPRLFDVIIHAARGAGSVGGGSGGGAHVLGGTIVR